MALTVLLTVNEPPPLQGPKDFVRSSAFHPKGGMATVSFKRVVVKNDKDIEVFSLPLPPLTIKHELAFCSDGSRLVLNVGNEVTVYETKSYRKQFSRHYISNCQPTLSPDGKRLALAPISSHDIQLYSDKGKLDRSLPLGRVEWVRSIEFSADGKRLLVVVDATLSVNVQMWNLTTKKLSWKTGLKGVRESAVFTPDGKEVVTCTAHGVLTYLNVKSGKVTREKQVFDFKKPQLYLLEHLRFGKDGSLLIVHSRHRWEYAWFKNGLFRSDHIEPDLVFKGTTVQRWEVKDGKLTMKQSKNVSSVISAIKSLKDGTIVYFTRGTNAKIRTISLK